MVFCSPAVSALIFSSGKMAFLPWGPFVFGGASVGVSSNFSSFSGIRVFWAGLPSISSGLKRIASWERE